MTTGAGGAPATSAAGGKNRHDVFVSYHDVDRRWVKGVLLPALDEVGLTYIDEDSFPLGQPHYEATERAIKASDRVIAVLTAAYVESRHTNLVTLLTAEYGDTTDTWPLIPVRRDDVALPPRLAMLVPLDMRHEEEWEAQIERLRSQFGATQIRPRPVPECPYPGMAPYTENDGDRFFGRSRDVDAMLDRLRSTKLLTVIGPSGSGKSSLVFAGLFARLASSQIAGRGGWELIAVRPGDDVYASLAAFFGAGAATEPLQLVSLMHERSQRTNLLVVIDQAEEIFTHAAAADAAQGRADLDAAGNGGRHDPEKRMAETLVLLEAEQNIHTVLTIRADFYGQLMSSDLWDVLDHTRFDVRPLRGDALREAIVEPAERVGVYVESGLVERIVADAAEEPGLLPFVQETMRMLWDRIQRRLLTLAGYEALVIARPEYGGATHGGLQVAMALHADATISKLDATQLQTAQRILIRLVQFGRGRANVRQQQRIDELRSAAHSEQAFEQVLEHLVDGRLVTVSGAQSGSGPRTVDLAHEALIAGWPQLRKWLDERSGAELARRYYVDLAERWREHVGSGEAPRRPIHARTWGWLRGQDADRGLSTADLAEAERWLASDHAHEVGFDRPPIVDLVAHSRSWHRARTRFWQGLTAFVVVLALTVAAAAGIALWLAGVARTEAERATALLLAQASERPPEEQDLAALLALEAVARDPSVENYGALKSSLEASPQIVRYLMAQGRPVLAVAASDDGRWLASGGEEPLVRLWDTTDDSDGPVALAGHGDEIMAVAFSLDGRWLASGSRDDTVRVWDLGDRERMPIVLTAAAPDPLVSECRTQEDPDLARDVRTVAFSPDGRMLAFAGHNGLVERYSTDGWSMMPPLSGHLCDVMDISFSPDGAMLASAARDDTVRIWERNTGLADTVIGDPAPNRNDDGDMRAVVWRPGSTSIAYAGNDGFVYLQDVVTGSVVQLGGHTERVFALVFDATGEQLYSGSADRAIAVWAPDAGPQAPRQLLGHRGAVRGLAVLPDGRLLSGGQSGYVEIWDPGRLVRLGRSLERADVTATAVAAGPETIVAGTFGGGLIAWNADSGSIEAISESLDGTPIRDVVAVEDDRYAAVTQGGSVGMWHPQSEDVRAWSAGTAEIRSLAHVVSVNRIVTGDADGVVRWWDPATGDEASEPLRLVGCSVVAMAVGPNEDVIIATCNESGLRMIELSGGLPVGVSHIDQAPMLAATFAPSGAVIAGLGEGLALLWRAGDLARSAATELDVVAGGVRAVAVDSNETRIATVADNLVFLWDVASGRLIGEPWQVGLRVRDVAFTADSRHLALVGDPGVHLLLDVDPEAWQTAACDLVRRNLTPAEWDQVVGSGAPVASCVP